MPGSEGEPPLTLRQKLARMIAGAPPPAPPSPQRPPAPAAIRLGSPVASRPGFLRFLPRLRKQVLIDRLHRLAAPRERHAASELEGPGGQALTVVAGLIADTELNLVRGDFRGLRRCQHAPDRRPLRGQAVTASRSSAVSQASRVGTSAMPEMPTRM